MDERLVELVQRTYGGEVLGVELFRELAEAEPDPDRRRRLEAARLLEEQTKDAAAKLAADLGIEVSETDDDREAGRRAASFLGSIDWAERMRAVGNATGNYRTLYGQLADAVPDPQHPCVVALIAHEQALNAFALAEADGDADALDILRAALDHDRRAQLEVLRNTR